MGLPLPPNMAASSGARNPLAPFMAPPKAAASSGAAQQSGAMPDMPSDINVEEARCSSHACSLLIPALHCNKLLYFFPALLLPFLRCVCCHVGVACMCLH